MTMAQALPDAPDREPWSHRPLLFSIAYRMLGSVAEAEDIVQEAFLRLHRARAEGVAIDAPRAWLASVATRLAIDHLRSARVRRETYVGEWLPEPVLTGKEAAVERSAELAESLSMAFLVVMEALSPVERAVFLLREVFDYEYAEIAAIVEKSEENCRQIFARARRHLEAGRPRYEAPSGKREDLARRFIAACEDGRMDDLVDLLAADALFVGDGGGQATATIRPVSGRDRVSRLMHGLFARRHRYGIHAREAVVNGEPGLLFLDGQDRLVSVMAFEIHDGRIHAIRSVVNPHKLGHLGYPLSDLTKLPRRPS